MFWIHASNAARLEQGYQAIAAVAEIWGRDDPKTNILQLLYQWLCDSQNGRWLMVLDNADDDGVFFDSNVSDKRGPLVSFLPQAAHGSLLVTSRNGLAAGNLVGNDGHMIEVQPMNEEESLALLRAMLPELQSEVSGEPGEDEKALVEALEYIPLAITPAGSYIATRLPLVTIAVYLRPFHESESKRTRLLQNEDSAYLRRDPSIRDSDQDELDFHDALAPLLSYSLIRLERKERLVDMHCLVQLSVRAWLDMHQQLHGWQAKSRRIMVRAFPDGNYENWTQCRTLLAHAKSVLNSICDVDDENR